MSTEQLKRYAIVRVDEDCPKEIDSKFVCNIKRDKYGIGTCYCRYGDTKEQLIRKVMTAFKIAIKKNKEGKFVKGKSNNRQVAEIIVEFLGVEDDK